MNTEHQTSEIIWLSAQVERQVFTKFKSSLKSFTFCWVKVKLKTVNKVELSSHLWQLIWLMNNVCMSKQQ